MKHHNHYLIHSQMCLLGVLGTVLAVSVGEVKLSSLVLILVMSSLTYISLKLCASIVKQLVPASSLINNTQMHGSMLPVTIVSPEY